jgi:L-histidine N-alpha-methyltransferase
MPIAPAPRFLQITAPAGSTPAEELAAGLSAPRPSISPKFLYDRLGSALFCALTELPEYYPTRTEAAIFAAHAPQMAQVLHQHVPPGGTLIDLGAGDGAKAASLFRTLGPQRYIALDISAEFLQSALQDLHRRFEAIEMVGVGLDFATRLALPPGLVQAPATVFYPGSSIGNFAPPDALRLLREAREVSHGGALLIGADLVKPLPVLEAAYDDALGLTAAFNLNLLRHANRLLGSDFDLRDWRHVAFFDVTESRIEMHLETRRALTVSWPGGERRFAAGERIHTENSYKWTAESFEALLRDAGWHGVRRWVDGQGWFGVFAAGA